MSGDRPFARAEIAALATVALCAAMLLVAALAFAVDERLLRGVNVWSKPVKFAASFGLHMATLLVIARLIADAARRGWRVAVALVGASVASLIEVFYVALQAARGRASHFNTETAFEAFMYYQVMGGAALAVVAATAALGALALRHAGPGVGEGLRLGAGWGAILGAGATLVVAGVLASGAVSGAGPWTGEPRSEAGGLPVTGWSRRTGDLRAPHFFATHLLQAMMLAGWLADRLGLGCRAARAAVGVVAALGLAVTALTFAQALAGRPLVGLAAAGPLQPDAAGRFGASHAEGAGCTVKLGRPS